MSNSPPIGCKNYHLRDYPFSYFFHLSLLARSPLKGSFTFGGFLGKKNYRLRTDVYPFFSLAPVYFPAQPTGGFTLGSFLDEDNHSQRPFCLPA